MKEDNHLQLGSIRVTDKTIAEIQDGHPIIEIPRSQILRIDLTHTIAAERPILQCLFGTLLMAPGIYCIFILLTSLNQGGGLAKLIIGGCLLFPLGLWCTVSALRKRILFHVHTNDTSRKILCDPITTSIEISKFAMEVSKRLGISIRNQLPKL